MTTLVDWHKNEYDFTSYEPREGNENGPAPNPFPAPFKYQCAAIPTVMLLFSSA
jgi:hypothetical protein